MNTEEVEGGGARGRVKGWREGWWSEEKGGEAESTVTGEGYGVGGDELGAKKLVQMRSLPVGLG